MLAIKKPGVIIFRRDLIKAALDAKKAEGITQEEIAKSSGCERGYFFCQKKSTCGDFFCLLLLPKVIKRNQQEQTTTEPTMKTRKAYGYHKESGKTFFLGDTVAKALEANMMVRDYEKALVNLNPHLEITFKIEKA